jgi:ribonucleotide monophosphatase NagD (HAD superfamily)
MIGDNPNSDIEGGNRKAKANLEKLGVRNWKTILLKTGVYKHGVDEANSPDYIVEDMKAAYELILKEEGLS